MRRISKTSAALTVGGALALGGIAVAAPVLAGGPGPGPGDRPVAQISTAVPGGPRAGYGMGQMRARSPDRGPHWGPGEGTCQGLTAPSGSVTAAQRATLADVTEQEKLTHDLYAAFAARYDARVFDRIAMAETQHLTMVRTLLGRYGVPDPTAGKAAGQFASAEVKATYDRLLAQGSAKEEAALQVGSTVEKADIAALRKAVQGRTAADITQVYNRLLTASQRHLDAFGAWAN